MKGVVSASGISKEFIPGLPVLANVDFTLYEGEVVALVGENGAGKSTLASILAGIHMPTSGTLRLRDSAYVPRSRRQAENLGVAIVTQELSLISTLTVAENLTFDRMPSRLGVIDRKRQHEAAKRALSLVGEVDLSPNSLVSELGVAQRQLVEIAGGLQRDCQVLILDEPTAALSPSESEILFQQLHRLRAQGVCIVYISHRLEEVIQLADRTVVLRDGTIAQTFGKSPDRNELIKAMVGRDIAQMATKKFATDQTALTLRNVRGVDLEVNKGEVVGLAGLVGAGRTELLRAVFQADKHEGDVTVMGRPMKAKTPQAAVKAGLGFVTEDRKDQGLFLPLTIRENISISVLRQLGRAGVEEKSLAERFHQKLRIRSESIERPVRQLSGGNQQKVVLAKWLARQSEVLLMDEPTRGIDVGARKEIYDLIEQMASEGKAVLMASSDMQELFLLCDRILVLSGGKVVDELNQDEFDADRIMRSALVAHGVAL